MSDIAANRQASVTSSHASRYSHNTERSQKNKTIARVGSVLAPEGEDATMCGCVWTKAARTFAVSLALCTTITAAQIAGALIANSMALMADCVSMALDSVTYALNLFMECKKDADEKRNRRNLLLSSGFSFIALLGISIYLLYDAASTIIEGDSTDAINVNGSLVPQESDSDEPNAWIVFGFATGGIVFDLLSLLPHFMYGCPCGNDERAKEDRQNLMSALSHTLADFLRSMTTFVESILILGYDVDAGNADAYATVIVLVIIIVGMIKPAVDWFGDLRSYVEDYGSNGVQEVDEKSKLVEA